MAADLACVRADNPGPYTLTGTNTYLVGRDPAWVVDPGPDLPDHRAAVLAAAQARGGIGGVVLTHDHPDHAEGVPALVAEAGGPPVAAMRHPAEVVLADGDEVGPFRVVATPGHAADHLSLLVDGTAFTGDAVLGTGSVFVAPYPGALRAYLAGLERLRRLGPEQLAPGHGPLVADAQARLAEYLEHRRRREARLVDALAAGARTVQELLDLAWSEVGPELRLPAAATLASHLDKLAEEGRLPVGVERPRLPAIFG